MKSLTLPLQTRDIGLPLLKARRDGIVPVQGFFLMDLFARSLMYGWFPKLDYAVGHLVNRERLAATNPRGIGDRKRRKPRNS